jgi:radical SAM protein (TIGR01212 family)
VSSVLRPLNTIGRYFRGKFGENVYKIPISISGFTCPNIDGTVAKGGCSFCENDSFSPNLQKNINRFKLNLQTKTNPYLDQQLLQLQTQYLQTKKVLSNKFKAQKYIIYFQSFTNTYAPLDTLKALYEKALSFDDVVGLSIGTRTDCIDDKTLEYILSLSQNYEIWIEYGIQTIYDETLQKINRGHDYANVVKWINKTKQKGIKVCGHLIFGLPDETQEMMLKTTEEVIKLGIDSIKFHPMYVTKNTLLSNQYHKGLFTPISEELYIDTVVKAIEMLPQNISIQRVTAGIGDNSLIAPLWCNDKHKQIYKIKEALKKAGFDY